MVRVQVKYRVTHSGGQVKEKFLSYTLVNNSICHKFFELLSGSCQNKKLYSDKLVMEFGRKIGRFRHIFRVVTLLHLLKISPNK